MYFYLFLYEFYKFNIMGLFIFDHNTRPNDKSFVTKSYHNIFEKIIKSTMMMMSDSSHYAWRLKAATNSLHLTLF